MTLFWHIFLALAGAVMILVAANYVTTGSVAVAKRFGVSDFVIGLTLVALGSSAPDLAVGLFSACKGHTQFAIGNVVGSCIFDGILVVGTVALISPFVVGRQMLRWQIPCLLVGYITIIICANDGAIDGFGADIITRAEGLLMLIIFGLMLWQTLHRGADPDKSISLSGSKPTPTPTAPKRWSTKTTVIVLAEIIGGLAALVWGGNLFVDGAAGIAREAHVSDTVIGLTVVALGTSLPDLATSAVAAWRRHPGIAVGNVAGSCLFDALVVLGASSIAAPLPMGGVGNIDLGVMVGGGLLLLVMSLCSRSRRINRWEGALLVAIYILYTVHVIIRA